MKKKEMISILVEEAGLNPSTLNTKLKQDIQNIYNKYFIKEKNNNGDNNIKSKIIDVSDVSEDINENKKILENKPLSKAQIRNLKRAGKL